MQLIATLLVAFAAFVAAENCWCTGDKPDTICLRPLPDVFLEAAEAAGTCLGEDTKPSGRLCCDTCRTLGSLAVVICGS